MMHMTIYWGKDVILLFDWWSTDSWPSYGVTLLACFVFSLFYQYMEDRRIRLKSIAASEDRASHAPAAIATPLLPKLRITSRQRRLAAAAIFGVNSAIGYLLMLAIMSFNGGVLLAVVLGLSVGFYLFRSGVEGEEAVLVENSCACS
ncbi:hypothetical protein NMG60_11005613 [Bertholletia excelsa]